MTAAGEDSRGAFHYVDRQAGGRPSDEPQAGITAVLRALGRLAGWDGAALQRDARRFAEIYTPVGILPPDQYLAQVVQLTHGCSFNTCTFCTFYRDIPFRIRTVEELRTHLAEVDAFLGRGALLRRSLFLGDANALVVPMSKLGPLVETVRDHYQDELDRFQGMHAFLDGFSGAKKDVADYQYLRDLGLTRVSVGMESGHDPLLAWLRKPGSAREVAEAARTMKAAGLQIALIALIGAGGQRFAEVHARDTAALLAGLPLDDRDIVYFSEYVDQPGAPYGVVAEEEGIVSLDRSAREAQRMEIAAGLTPHSAGGPRTGVYDIREFTY